MKVFISWSGESSRKVAIGLKKFLKEMLPPLEIWVSQGNIGLGSRWLEELSKGLQDCNFGILCLTPENINSPWIAYEAGALAKVIERSLVIPYFIQLDPKDVKYPLAQFQGVVASMEGTGDLLATIKSRMDILGQVDFDANFQKFWPELEQILKDLTKMEPAQELKEAIDSLSQNMFLIETVRALSRFSKLDVRCSKEAPLKEALAKFFCQQYGAVIRDNSVNIFLESGSTLAYVAKELSELLSDIFRDPKATLKVSTNNVLAYLQLWLSAKVPCSLFPRGPPEKDYGAIFGDIGTIMGKDPYYGQCEDLRYEHIYNNSQADTAIRNLQGDFFTITGLNAPDITPPSLLLGAISGLQLSKVHNIPPDTPQATVDEINECYGLHVGSYHNMLFKRFLYKTHLPLMIFLTKKKIDCEIIPGTCQFIFVKKDDWDEFLKRYPLAFCVGCPGKEVTQLSQTFSELGFEIHAGPEYHANSALIARNGPFISKFEQRT